MVSSARSLCCLPSSKLPGGTSISRCDLCSSDATASVPSLCAQQCAVQCLQNASAIQVKPSGCTHTGLYLDADCCLNCVNKTSAIAEPHQHALFSSFSGQALTRCSNMHQRFAELWVCISTRLYTCARAISILTKLISAKCTKHRLLSTDEFDLRY